MAFTKLLDMAFTASCANKYFANNKKQRRAYYLNKIDFNLSKISNIGNLIAHSFIHPKKNAV